jgi:hypothetical protein
MIDHERAVGAARCTDPNAFPRETTMTKIVFQHPDLIEHATHAYFRTFGKNADQPGSAESTVEEIDGKRYVFLRNVRGRLAVYVCAPDGRLARITDEIRADQLDPERRPLGLVPHIVPYDGVWYVLTLRGTAGPAIYAVQEDGTLARVSDIEARRLGSVLTHAVTRTV